MERLSSSATSVGGSLAACGERRRRFDLGDDASMPGSTLAARNAAKRYMEVEEPGGEGGRGAWSVGVGRKGGAGQRGGVAIME